MSFFLLHLPRSIYPINQQRVTIPNLFPRDSPTEIPPIISPPILRHPKPEIRPGTRMLRGDRGSYELQVADNDLFREHHVCHQGISQRRCCLIFRTTAYTSGQEDLRRRYLAAIRQKPRFSLYDLCGVGRPEVLQREVRIQCIDFDDNWATYDRPKTLRARHNEVSHRNRMYSYLPSRRRSDGYANERSRNFLRRVTSHLEDIKTT